MAVVPMTQPEKEIRIDRRGRSAEDVSWTRMAAAGSLVAGGILLATGNRKAGLLTAAAGTALALLDQQETVRAWWNALPGYIDDVQSVLGKVEQSVAEVENQRARLQKAFSR